MTDVNWCCPGLEFQYVRGGERGVAVLYKNTDGEVKFFLQFRALERGVQRLANAPPIPVSLIEQVPISFCPWCGKQLVKHYKKQIERLPVLATLL